MYIMPWIVYVSVIVCILVLIVRYVLRIRNIKLTTEETVNMMKGKHWSELFVLAPEMPARITVPELEEVLRTANIDIVAPVVHAFISKFENNLDDYAIGIKADRRRVYRSLAEFGRAAIAEGTQDDIQEFVSMVIGLLGIMEIPGYNLEISVDGPEIVDDLVTPSVLVPDDLTTESDEAEKEVREPVAGLEG